MKRRQVIAGLGGIAAAWPVVARAQQAMPVIGFLSGVRAGGLSDAAFHQGLKESGFVVGQNVAIEYRWAEGQYERLPALATDLINMRVTVIATFGDAAALAAKAARAATANGLTIPIVFSLGGDPVAAGLVTSLNRPSDNITGSTSINQSLGPKRVELLREFVPSANAIALLTNPNSPRESERKDIEEKAHAFGWPLRVLTASSPSDFASVFATLVGERIGGLIVTGDTVFLGSSKSLAAFAIRHAVPTVGPLRAFAEAGGLISYGPSIPDVMRQAGVYAGRVIKGTKPADLPVMQPSKFELVINLITAKVLDLTVPPTLLARADEVIE